MIRFVLKRVFYGFLVLLGVICVVFFLFNVLPGDPARMMLGQRADKASIEAINKDLGRDKPLRVQFAMYMNDLSPLSIHDLKDEGSCVYLFPEKYEPCYPLFSLGSTKALVLKFPYLRRSYQNKKKVSDIILETLPETTVLAISSIVLGALLGILGGIICAVWKHRFIDNFTQIISILGMSSPQFFIGPVFAWLFGLILADYTGLSPTGSLYTVDDYGVSEYLDLKNLFLPALTLGIRPLAIIVLLTRSSMLDVLSQDYIRTSTAKGLSKGVTIFKHALKNALNPVVTAISGWFAGLMAGAIFVERIFGWKGLGNQVVEALEKYDLPVVMGTVLVSAIIFVFINIIVDIVYGFLDPRVRVQN